MQMIQSRLLRLISFLLMAAVPICFAQRTAPPTAAELADISARGRVLFEYDQAAWHATDAVLAEKPASGTVQRYIAQKTETGWVVSFGRLDGDRAFLVGYQAMQSQTAPDKISVNKFETPHADTGFLLFAARAVNTALKDFGKRDRPYNIAVLPAPEQRLYVYAMPAQTKNGIFPLGGDARYLISPDGKTIVTKRQLHNAILEIESGPDTVAGTHVAVLDDIPEDTDVFHVLARTPSMPEYIMTNQFFYVISPDGAIHYMGKSEDYLEDKEESSGKK
jgi:hypothetical protein